jgi:hypothetical protein
MTEFWACWYWPIALSHAWLDAWFGAPAARAAPADDALPCEDHALFA